MANKDQAKGSLKKTMGKIKEKIGGKTNDPKLQDKGTAERAKGGLQKGKGNVKDKI